jgi:hypothetical protein
MHQFLLDHSGKAFSIHDRVPSYALSILMSLESRREEGASSRVNASDFRRRIDGLLSRHHHG